MTKNQTNQRCRGTALAETALILSILCLVMLAAFQYGWLFLCAQRVTNAARQGARMESVLNAQAGAAQTAMTNMVADLLPTTCTVSTAGEFVTATVTVPAKGNTKVQLINWDLLPVPATLQAEVKMAKEGAF